MPRRGRSAGESKAYAQRTDLMGPKKIPIDAPTGQPYGVRAEQIAAQRAIPIARPQTDFTASTPAQSGAAAPATPRPSAPPGPLAGQVVPLDAPSARPGEPVTAGLSVGAGPGPEVLGALRGPGETTADELRAIFVRFPTEEMRSLLETLGDD
jgi:hypothetical protein